MPDDTSHPNAALFSFYEECEHNRRVLKALAHFYAYHTQMGNTERATINREHYFQFLKDYKTGLDTDSV